MYFLINNISIKKLTLCIFIVMYIIFLSITGINLYSYSQYEFNKTEKLICNYNTNLSQQINQKIDGVIDVSKYPLIIPEIDKVHDILNKGDNYNISDYNYLLYLCEMMLIQNDSINGAYIYNMNGNGIYSSRNSKYNYLKNPTSEEWFTNCINSDNEYEVYSNISSSNIFSSKNSPSENLIAVTRKIVDVKNKKITGVLLLTVPLTEIISIDKNDLPFTNQIVSIYDIDNSNILSTTNKKTEDISYIKYCLPNISDDPTINYIYSDVENIVCYNRVLSRIALINIIPKTDAYHIDSLYLFSFFGNIVFGLFLFIILYLFFLKRIFNPINSLIENMGTNIEYSLTYKFSYNKNDEIGILVNSYNKMKSRINNLININYKTQIEQKELELKQLQNQINPHFIYNTLESIHMMAEINDDFETSTMAEYFGTIIRYSMNRKINTVTLRDEIAIIDNYIYLQKMRFDNLFTITNLISEDVLDCEIIKMIIQPLIENSINHGLSECSENGKIIIQSFVIDGNLVLNISDNGIGIEEKKLESLNDYINGKNEDFKGIALRNINKRLKLNYGNEYGLEVFSVIGNGTSISLTLPYIVNTQ
ncbi:MAG: sensor histidine kinase [Clostridium butyricum]|nr:sensor histidine kinase [Clostridium butyricum]